MLYLLGLLFVVLGVRKFVLSRKATVIITTVTGLMLGALYNKDIWEEDNVSEHTLQFCLLLLTVTIQWERQLGFQQ